MIAKWGATRRAEEFAALVDGLPARRDPTPAVVEAIGVVTLLRDVEPVSMRPEFATALRARLMLEAPERLAELAATTAGDSGRALDAPPAKRARFAQVAAVTCLAVGIAGGVAAASQSALPGDPLYGVKRGIERVQVGIAGSDATEGQRLVSQANTRLEEINELAVSHPDDPTRTRLIQQTLDEFSDQATSGADALITSYEHDSDASSIIRLREFTGSSARDLDDLSTIVPAPARRDLLDAAQVLSELDQEARDACAACSSLAPLDVSQTMKQLATTAKSLLDLPDETIPDNDPRGTGAQSPQQSRHKPLVDLPTLGQAPGGSPSLPSLTEPPGQDGSTATKPPSTTSPKPGGGSAHATTPGPLLPELPLPSLPLPSLPLLGGLLGQQ